MKRSKAFLTALTIFWCVFAVVAVQGASSQIPGVGGGGMPSIPGMGNIQQLAQKLHLSPQQVSQLQPILQNELTKITGIKNNSQLSGQQKVQQAQTTQSQTDTQVKSILDPSQYKQWQGIRADQFTQLKDSLLH
ncbi:MAG TPA: hypothetical protein VFL42_02870 [Terriglobales bacterium]|jgi:hypothetical protein|nr:hypothetical protein [Terriglobales bacterium]